SSEMVFHLLPLYLSSVLGVRANVIGLVEGLAQSISSLLKVFAGNLSDRLGARKWLAVAGYGVSALAKPFFLVAGTWTQVGAARWAERVGKGVRTAPRDALLADSAKKDRRGFVFGLHRTADTLGAVVGLGIAMVVVATVGGSGALDAETFRRVVLWSLPPAFLAVLILAVVGRDLPAPAKADSGDTGAARPRPTLRLSRLGRPFVVFLAISALFDLGCSADAFLVLRAAERGAGVVTILGFLLLMNLVYALVSTPGSSLSDRWGRRRVLALGWGVYAVVYLGFALAPGERTVGALFALYGVYHGLSHGTAKAFVADLVPADLRGTAYGTYHATLGILDLPASLIAGILWHGLGTWGGFGPAAPFFFGAASAVSATLLLLWIGPRPGAAPTRRAG
ncbi:MAG: MFS transporter, partial [Holophagales bacterium]|nr:MFS transporter [Holophagales bacterium]